ncbi:alpha/beta hydrolase [Campylobacter sp. VicNov18]|uniref:alpha/beta fold hydrolase n=1 Tax=Campylobacter bilis TaxID=2691918 RepID=UPI00130EBDA3|nr:alpha/beta hydrolase [Campylobacter bilis]MPV63590.1 alpha/beta fold hydrolase [Campylobacter hepaticus]MBM0637090.1 alpha/beta fold hydrolase [Campylobacter bilis]MCC8277752.1 alpha/beta hydrolase [Campylobacter bilis]MCC8299361.1 alpha/beta hydrolase [Campylobacter bilis]MCC8300661.1 alpha/beta hydrolase [Campylobacter bilis]
MAQTQLVYKDKNYQISYEIIGEIFLPQILILHGWGANKELMKQSFWPFLKDFCQIYIDLAGFGKSSIAEVLNTQDYANIIKLFLKQKKLNVCFFMGHSFGGKISALLAKEQDTLILLSSAGILKQKSLKIRLKIRIFKILKRLGLGKFYPYFVSKDGVNLNPIMYATFKKVVDEDFSEIFSQQKAKSLIFWGKEDKATPLACGQILHELLQNSTFYPLEGDHFFFLKHSAFIAQKLLAERKTC